MIVAGLGFRSAAAVPSLRDALARAGGSEVAALATAADKAGAAAIVDLAAELGLRSSPSRPPNWRQPVAARSPRVAALRGTGSVAEAAALAAAGPETASGAAGGVGRRHGDGGAGGARGVSTWAKKKRERAEVAVDSSGRGRGRPIC